jgi:hypothetical protein
MACYWFRCEKMLFVNNEIPGDYAVYLNPTEGYGTDVKP